MDTIKVKGKYYVSLEDIQREEEENNGDNLHDEIDFYKDIIYKISPHLLEDAEEFYNATFINCMDHWESDECGDCRRMDFIPEKYKIVIGDSDLLSEKQKKEELIREISNLKSEICSLECSRRNLKTLNEKLKMGMDKRVLLRETDFTKIKNMSKLINEFYEDMLERKRVLFDESDAKIGEEKVG